MRLIHFASMMTSMLMSFSSVSAIETIEIDSGNSQVLKLSDIRRISIANSQVIRAKTLSSNELVIFGLTSGTTSLEIWLKNGTRRSYRVEVISGNLRKTFKDISRMLASIPNVKVSVTSNQVVIEGENLSDSDRNKIRSVIKRFPETMDLTSQVGWDSMVLLDVQVLELPSSQMKELGVRWDPSTQGGIHSGLIWESQHNASHSMSQNRGIDLIKEGAKFGSSIGLNALLSSKLQALTRSGEAVVLARPQLLTRSGTTASFLAGGELPYTSVDKDGKSNTNFRKYGVSLSITPEVDRTEVVRSKIEIEVSSVDATVSTPGGPALKIRKATSDFNVKSGQTLVIGGFISREKHADRDGLPGLSSIPVAGYLFGSHREQGRETELAIFVTPVVVDSHHVAVRSRVQSAREITQHAFPDPALMNHELSHTHDSNQTSRQRPLVENQDMINPAPNSDKWFGSQWNAVGRE